MTNSIPESNVTIDDLAIMIANGFRGVDKRFETFEARFNGLEGRLDGVEGRLTSLENKVDQMDMRLTSQLDYMALNYTDRISRLMKSII
jgi:hypothetical protein